MVNLLIHLLSGHPLQISVSDEQARALFTQWHACHGRQGTVLFGGENGATPTVAIQFSAITAIMRTS
jgi:hypothetical protein